MSLQQLKKDPVYSLITGRFEKVKKIDGKIIEIFVPSKRNPYPTLSEIEKKTGLNKNSILVQERLIYPPLIINRDELIKNESERNKLKHLKYLWKKSLNA